MSATRANWLPPLRTFCGRLPWVSAGIAAGTVAFGFSNVPFTLVLQETTWFPTGGAFHFWTIFWMFLLPFGIVLTTDALLARHGEERLPVRIWRAALYTLVILSNLRQFSVYYSELFEQTLAAIPWVLLYGLPGAGLFALFLRARARHHVIPALFGFLALYVPANYAVSSGLVSGDSRVPAPPPAETSAPPIFLIVLDELSYPALLKDGRVDAEAFPHFAELSGDGLWFTHATTNHALTTEAIPTLLNGTIWTGAGTRTLFQRLSSRYRIRVIESAMDVESWIRSVHATGDPTVYRGKHHVLDTRPLLAAEYVFRNLLHSPFLNDRRIKQLHNSPAIHVSVYGEFDILLDAARAENSKGWLTFWHCSLPHAPFLYDREGRRHGGVDAFHGVPKDEEPPPEVFESYREQIKLVDSLVGRFIAHLKREGLYDRSILIVTADHGIRVWGREREFSEWTAPIPFFVRAPGVEARISDRDVQLMDLAPTLFDLLQFPAGSPEFEGVSVLADSLPDRKKTLYWRFGPDHFEFNPESGTWFERTFPNAPDDP